MIGRLKGTIINKMPPELLLDVAGVGYELEVPMSTFYELPPVDSEVVLLTHLLVREDAQLLYGFATDQERQLFRSLIKISGVGAKVALAILSAVGADEFIVAVDRKDIASLMRIPGIGKKTAERLLVELQDKLSLSAAALPAGKVGADNSSSAEGTNAGVAGFRNAGDSRTQAIDALVTLGYKPAESTRMVDSVVKLEKAGDLAVEDIIRAALKGTVKS